MTPRERDALVTSLMQAAASAKEPGWSAYMTAMAEWTARGCERGQLPQIGDYVAGAKKADGGGCGNGV